MKKVIPAIFLLALYFSCTSNQNEVDRVVENGVEVVINHLEPYKIKGKPSSFSLTKEFGIDTERDELAELGLVDIGAFDIDVDGNVYILCSKNDKNLVYKFDKKGNFLLSFGKKGQGPGEFQSPTYLGIDSSGKIDITDARKRRLIIFDSEGNLEKEIPFKNRIIFIHPLENGKYLVFYQIFDLPGGDFESQAPLSLWSPEFRELQELGRLMIPNYSKHKKRKGTVPIFCWSVSGERIFFGNDDRGYEIAALDLEGKILRKIKKQYKGVPIPKEYKKERMEDLHPREKEITYFPDEFPPYQTLFSDDAGRLFVMTYEESDIPGEYMFDIFNSEGVFIGRKSLGGFVRRGGYNWVKVQQNHLYGVVQKEGGYEELVVYKMTWE